MPPSHNWSDIPARVRAAAEELAGPIYEDRSIVHGFSSHLSTILTTAEGRVFVKGMHRDHPRAWTQGYEELINPYVRSLGPSLLWRVVLENWDLLGFAYLPGRCATFAPGSSDIPLVVDTLTVLSTVRCSDPRLKKANERWLPYLDDPADAELFSGDALLHTDWNHTNVLMVDGSAKLVDWAWAVGGAAWTDLACWIIWLIYAGHDPAEAEQWVAKVPSWHQATEKAIKAFSVVQARFWLDTAHQYPSTMTAQLRDAATRWATYHRAQP